MATESEQKPADLVRQRAKEERRLLRAEQAAERKLLKATERLAVAESRLEQQQTRVERRRERVATAREDLRRRQEARAIGPNGTAAAPTPPPPAAASAQSPIPARDDSPVMPQIESVPAGAATAPSDGAKPARRPTRRRSAKTDASA
ncbi:MAG TPA: hypothetical protein VH482_14290 [Thermomicrobiales bacterium]|jgi:hypothetical protein